MTARAWIIRGTEDGEGESFALDNHRAINAWGDTGDLTHCNNPIDVNHHFSDGYPDVSGIKRFSLVWQLWMFRNDIHVGDVIVTPLIDRPGLAAIGVCAGTYEFVERHGMVWRHHTIPVAWITRDARVAGLDPDLRRLVAEPYSTDRLVAEIPSPDAAARLLQYASRGTDPGPKD